MRVLLDANVLFSMLLSTARDSPIIAITDAIARRRFTPIVCEVTLDEMANSIQKKKYLADRISSDDLGLLRHILEDTGQIVPAVTTSSDPILRDTKDDYLIVTARRHQVDMLVSGDDDVLAHAGNEPFAILSPPAFVAALKELAGE